MRRTSRLLVVFGIGLAVLTFVLIVALLPGGGPNGNSATPTPIQNVTVVVAAKDIPLGTVVTADMLSTTTVPVEQAKTSAFTNTGLVIGQTTRQAILTGEQLSADEFSGNQTSITVPTGKRALAISVDQLSGVGNLIFPGDTVDLVISLDERAIKVVNIPAGSTAFTHDDTLSPETVKASALLQDLQVLGTLEAPVAPPPTSNGAAASPAASQGPTFNGTAVAKLIILAVTDDQAEAILFARDKGTINLLLRSTADASAPPINTSGVDLKTLFDKYGILPPYVVKTIPVFIPNQP